MAKDVLDMYNHSVDASNWYNSSSLQQAQIQESTVFDKWNVCFESFNLKQSNSNTAKICQHHTTTYNDFIKSLDRNAICIDDVRSVLTNKGKFSVKYTDQDTYLSKDPNFIPIEEKAGLSLFEGL
jgi:hypothetical protein